MLLREKKTGKESRVEEMTSSSGVAISSGELSHIVLEYLSSEGFQRTFKQVCCCCCCFVIVSYSEDAKQHHSIYQKLLCLDSLY